MKTLKIVFLLNLLLVRRSGNKACDDLGQVSADVGRKVAPVVEQETSADPSCLCRSNAVGEVTSGTLHRSW